jgi:hypothetical protein
MAMKRAGEFPIRAPRNPSTVFERYPLSDWFDGDIWQLEPGIDFTENLPTIRSALRYWAYQVYQGTIRTRVVKEDGRRYLLVQFTPDPAADATQAP